MLRFVYIAFTKKMKKTSNLYGIEKKVILFAFWILKLQILSIVS